MDSRLVSKHHQGTVAGFIFSIPVFFLLFFLIVPLYLLVNVAFTNAQFAVPWDLAVHALSVSVRQALASTLLSAAIGVPLAILYVDSGLKMARYFWNLSLVCFSLPTLLVCLSLIGVWGKSGWLGQWLPFEFYGWFGVLFAHCFLNFGVIFRSTVERLQSGDRTLEKAAQSLGASRLQVFSLIVWPKIRRSVATGALLVFLYCFTSFLVVLLLGGGPRFTTLEVLIYQALRMDVDLPLAAILSVIQFALCGSLFIFLKKLKTQASSGMRSDFPVFRCRNQSQRLLALLFLNSVLVIFGGVILQLLVSGAKGLPLIMTAEICSLTLRGILLSSGVGCLSCVLGLITAFVLHRTRLRVHRAFLSFCLVIPMLLSSIIISMAVFTGFGHLEFFQGSLWGPFIVQTLMGYPIATRYLSSGFERVPVNIRYAAAASGASAFQTLRWVELPLLKSAMKLGFALVFCLSVGEVGSLLMFAVGGDGILPLWIYRQMGRYHFQEAAAGSTLLLLVLLLIFVIIGREERKIAS